MAPHTRAIEAAGNGASSQPRRPIASMKLLPVSPAIRVARSPSHPPGRLASAAPVASPPASATTVTTPTRGAHVVARSRHHHRTSSAATTISGARTTSRATRESFVTPHAIVTNVEAATTICGPTPSDRHHSTAVRPP
jgi:hypothetical protein